MIGFNKVAALIFAVTVAARPQANAAAGLEKRQTFPSVTNDLSTLSTSIATLSNSIVAYTTVAGLTPILSASNNVIAQINKTRDDVVKTPVATPDQAQTICDYFKNSLIPVITRALNALVGKKPQFVKDNAVALARDQLVSQSKAAQSLALSLIAKAPSAKKSCASSASSAVISLFNSALSVFPA